jgi:hypothetical protein
LTKIFFQIACNIPSLSKPRRKEVEAEAPTIIQYKSPKYPPNSEIDDEVKKLLVYVFKITLIIDASQMLINNKKREWKMMFFLVIYSRL